MVIGLNLTSRDEDGAQHNLHVGFANFAFTEQKNKSGGCFSGFSD
jgi:hypothetical protein